MKRIFLYGKENNCSDIHIASGYAPMVRIDGEMMTIPNFSVLSSEQVAKLLEALMSESQRKKFDETLEMDFSVQVEDGLRFRANAYHTIDGPAASFRYIASEIKSLASLDVPEVIKSFTDLKKGLVLVVGPTGSGKSTTIAALVDQINANYTKHIISIEDPVEFVHYNKKSLISQREVGINTFSFQNALRAALREDPDVIVVGEMRDLETTRLVLTAAETGHLVFATLHTNSASQSINRIIDIFPSEDKMLARSMLSTSLKAIVSQRLVKKKGGGRHAAYEILLANSSVRNLIREDKIPQINSIIELNKKSGMCLMKDSIAELRNREIISPEIAEDFLRGGEFD